MDNRKGIFRIPVVRLIWAKDLIDSPSRIVNGIDCALLLNDKAGVVFVKGIGSTLIFLSWNREGTIIHTVTGVYLVR